MKVKQLINLLAEQDQEAQVMLYDDIEEGGGMAIEVTTNSIDDPTNMFYFKGEHPLNYTTGLNKVVVIVSR